MGLIISTHTQQQKSRERLTKFVAEVKTAELALWGDAEEIINAIENSPDAAFVRTVEDGLRHLADYDELGQSPLAGQLGVERETHIERGKAVRQLLMQAIETLRPAAQRPAEPLPREWYSYTILHDAYIADVPNREIMSRLYISEGTFNRNRRKALRAVARALVEMKRLAAAEVSAQSPAG